MTVSVILPVILPSEAHRIMAIACIETMRCNTEEPYELVIVETGSRRLRDLADVHVHREARTSYVRDFNAGITASKGDLLVHTGSDLFVGPKWLEAMLEVFERMPDAGAATLACAEPAAFLGPQRPEPTINESFFGALFMFPRQYRLDEKAYVDVFSDNDLCMQVYADGKRAYRNNACVCHHLKQVSIDEGRSRDDVMRRFREGMAAFDRKWHDAPWLIKHLIIKHGVQYGREHEW